MGLHEIGGQARWDVRSHQPGADAWHAMPVRFLCYTTPLYQHRQHVALLHIHIHALPASRGVPALQVLGIESGDGGGNVCDLPIAGGNHVARDLHAAAGRAGMGGWLEEGQRRQQ